MHTYSTIYYIHTYIQYLHAFKVLSIELSSLQIQIYTYSTVLAASLLLYATNDVCVYVCIQGRSTPPRPMLCFAGPTPKARPIHPPTERQSSPTSAWGMTDHTRMEDTTPEPLVSQATYIHSYIHTYIHTYVSKYSTLIEPVPYRTSTY